MKFTSATLRLTSDQFRAALRSRGISVRWEAGFNLWSQIVTGKNYSAATSLADKEGAIKAIPIDTGRISALFWERSREIDAATAVEIFGQAISANLADISFSMDVLWHIVRSRRGCCVRDVSGGAHIGIFDQDKPGYLPIERLPVLQDKADELAWLRTSPEFAADVVNRLAGISGSDEWEITRGAIRKGLERNEEDFVEYFKARVPELSAAIADALLADWSAPDHWEHLDYDKVSAAVFDVLDAFCRKGAADTKLWLKADCSIGEAVLDHVTARARDGLRVFAAEPDEARESLADTVEFAIRKILP